jgi:DNA-binding SARP family transcriptional activator
MIHLALFGGASLATEEGPLTGPAAQRRRLALLALLAAAPAGGTSRDKLMGYLWPDVDTGRARHFLADSIYTLRKALGQHSILSLGASLRLNPDVIRSDVQLFEAALVTEDWQGVVAAYRGPFMDGLFVAGAAEFERWVETARERYARLCALALEALAEDRERSDDHCGAVEWWRRLAAHEPYSSRVALRLMQALEATGDPGGALRHSRLHEGLLRDALDIAPDDRVIALTHRLRHRGAPSRPR